MAAKDKQRTRRSVAASTRRARRKEGRAKRMKKVGWVYVIYFGRSIYKIGITRKPQPRLEAFRRQALVFNDAELRVHILHQIECPAFVERILHKLFSDKRVLPSIGHRTVTSAWKTWEYFYLEHEDLLLIQYLFDSGILQHYAEAVEFPTALAETAQIP